MEKYSHYSEKKNKRRLYVLSIAILVGSIVLVSPWKMLDPDFLSHISIGRIILQTVSVPRTDPFTFSYPQALYVNPEWIGDVIWYLLYQTTGEASLQIFKLLIINIGWTLVLWIAIREGSRPLVAVLILMMMLPATWDRFILRNHIHAYWLIPLYWLILLKMRNEVRLVVVLLPLGIIWANLHSSFILGWVILAAAAAQALLEGRRTYAVSVIIALAIHPFMAVVSPFGFQSYLQLWDHIAGSGVYRSLLLEWNPDWYSSTFWSRIPVHVLGLSGLLSFLPRCNRRRLDYFVLFTTGLVLAHGSQRFIPLLAVLGAPVTAINITRWLSRKSASIQRAWMLILLILSLGAAGSAIWSVRAYERKHVLARKDAPIGVSGFINNEAPGNSRLFNPYNSGPWLLWMIAPRVKLYIDPRNNLGAQALRRYVQDLLPNPGQFEREAQRTDITLSLVDMTNADMSFLREHLNRSDRWRLVYMDGRFALYARDNPLNAELISRYAYSRIRGVLGFNYLLSDSNPEDGDPAVVSNEDIETDIRQLGIQSPDLAMALNAFMLLCEDGYPPPIIRKTVDLHKSSQARILLEEALRRLPPSAALMTYLATAYARLGDLNVYDELMRTAKQIFPDDPLIMAMEKEMAAHTDDGKRR